MDLGHEVSLVTAVDVSPEYVGWIPTPIFTSQRIVFGKQEMSKYILVPVRVGQAMTLLRLQARSVLDLDLGLIECNEVLQDGPPSFTTDWSNSKH